MMLNPVNWIGAPEHTSWLRRQTASLLDFHLRASADPSGGFWWVDANGDPMPEQGKQLWINARHVYSFAIGSLLGHPGCRPKVESGLDYLRNGSLRDPVNGGWYWAVDEHGSITNGSKQSYGHAFVLLAALAAKIAGHESDDLIRASLDILETRFWSESDGLYMDTWDAGFTELESYRGQNANMHLVEALMLAGVVLHEPRRIERAVGISERLIRDITAGNGWRLPEHYDDKWRPSLEYGKTGDNLFRPYGSTVGHWLEWSRLLLQLNSMMEHPPAWLTTAAATLFDKAVAEGWDRDSSGFIFSTDWSGKPVDKDRYHWVIAEAIGAAAALFGETGNTAYSDWYSAFWDFAAERHISLRDGSWTHQLDEQNAPAADAWSGKPDLYHALQATLFARVPLAAPLICEVADGSLDGGTR